MVIAFLNYFSRQLITRLKEWKQLFGKDSFDELLIQG